MIKGKGNRRPQDQSVSIIRGSVRSIVSDILLSSKGIAHLSLPLYYCITIRVLESTTFASSGYRSSPRRCEMGQNEYGQIVNGEQREERDSNTRRPNASSLCCQIWAWSGQLSLLLNKERDSNMRRPNASSLRCQIWARSGQLLLLNKERDSNMRLTRLTLKCS